MTAPRAGPSRPLVVFELFLGLRSIGTVAWGTGGWIWVSIRDEAERAFLLEHLAGPHARGSSEEIRVRREDLSAQAFEEACLALPALRGYEVAPRPVA